MEALLLWYVVFFFSSLRSILREACACWRMGELRAAMARGLERSVNSMLRRSSEARLQKALSRT